MPNRIAINATRDQVVVASGQIAAGVGNMAFALIMARLLTPSSFSQLASFLAVYVLLAMPGTSISAASAVAPTWASHVHRRLLWSSVLIGLGLIGGSLWIGPLLRLPIPLVVILGLSVTPLTLAALERGRLYVGRVHGRLVASFLVDPAVRLSMGVALGWTFGVIGAGFAVLVGCFSSFEIARRGKPRLATPQFLLLKRQPTRDAMPIYDPLAFAAATWTAVAFLILAVIQCQDLLIANRLLSPVQAGQFAVLSTIGGVSAFATATVPLVLLPRVLHGGARDALLPALLLTALLGGLGVVAALIAPVQIVTVMFGTKYVAVSTDLALYMLAMALLGISRVLIAHLCTTSGHTLSVRLVTLAAVLQALLIIRFAHDIRAVTLSTLTATAVMSVSLGVALAMRHLLRHDAREFAVRRPET